MRPFCFVDHPSVFVDGICPVSLYLFPRIVSSLRSQMYAVQPNHGYDDERGDYNTVMHDHIGYRYEVLSELGKGSFGQVVKCYDYKTQTCCALKIIRNKKRFHQQALIEVKLLEHLRDNDPEEQYNMVKTLDYFYFRNHLCITFECLSINLYEFIKNNNFQGLSLGLIRRFAIQLLASLRYLRKHRIIHCDLKPENILLKAPNKSVRFLSRTVAASATQIQVLSWLVLRRGAGNQNDRFRILLLRG